MAEEKPPKQPRSPKRPVCRCGHGYWRHKPACSCGCALYAARDAGEPGEGEKDGKPPISPQSSRVGARAQELETPDAPPAGNADTPPPPGDGSATPPADTPPQVGDGSDAARASSAQGAPRGRVPVDDPLKRSLQFAVWFEYTNDGLSFLEISAKRGMDRGTVAAYVRLEAERQEHENADLRAADIQRSIARYESLIKHYTEKMLTPHAKGDEGRYIIMARERIDKLLGLDAPLKVKDETPPDGNPLAALGAGGIAKLLARVAERRAGGGGT